MAGGAAVASTATTAHHDALVEGDRSVVRYVEGSTQPSGELVAVGQGRAHPDHLGRLNGHEMLGLRGGGGAKTCLTATRRCLRTCIIAASTLSAPTLASFHRSRVLPLHSPPHTQAANEVAAETAPERESSFLKRLLPSNRRYMGRKGETE